MTNLEMLNGLKQGAIDFIKTLPPNSRIDTACYLAKYINFIAANNCADYNLRLSNLVCTKCLNTGMNHGIQVEPSKEHPTGWKSAPCACDFSGT